MARDDRRDRDRDDDRRSRRDDDDDRDSRRRRDDDDDRESRRGSRDREDDRDRGSRRGSGRSGGGSFNYKRPSREAVRSAATQSGGNYDSIVKDGVKLFKPREGKNTIRILPPTDDRMEFYALDIWCNYGIGVDQQTYLSLSKMLGKKDPLDDARKEAEKDGDTKLAKALAAKKRRGMYLVDRNAEEDGVQFWPAAWTFDKDLVNVCVDEDTNAMTYIDDPYEGNDIRFYKEGTGRNTKYPASKIKILPKGPLSEDERQMEDWLAFAKDNPIPDILQYYDYDHIEAAFGGVARTNEDDDDDDRRGGRRGGRDRDDRRGSRDRDDDRGRRGRDRSEDDDDRRSSRRRDDDDDDRRDRRKRDDDDDDRRTRKRDDDDDDRRSSRKRDDDDDDKRDRRGRDRDDDDDRRSDRRSRDRDRDDDRARDKDDDDDRGSRRRRDDDDDKKDDKRGSVKDRLAEMRERSKDREKDDDRKRDVGERKRRDDDDDDDRGSRRRGRDRD